MGQKKQTPTVRLRRLAAELRRLRQNSGLPREEVMERTGLNIATLYRLESAKARPQARTLATLLRLYKVKEPYREYLIQLCRDAAIQGWLRQYHAELPEEYAAYISFEDEAQRVRNYESLLLPGLLQTERYARAVIRGVLPTATDAEVEDRVRARMERQAVLTKKSRLKLWAVVDEASLHRMVGGPEVMLDQLNHLASAMNEPNITLQVIRYSAGAHPGMPGQFSILEFADPMDTDLIYVDSMAGDFFLESDVKISHFRTSFDTLVAVAASPIDSASLIADLAREMKENVR
ncbi:transcriptional regulator [Actinophytocola xinjiangensis]|uniref:Transcriptional regulator n=1 Tax=Actinophytocola xinjiangensis TaxID=485602 RepID=A0A7Z1AUZ3_9PSEU|nr:helix-turn-helix transcriptional regulator [Actinophytocola xinjiangensis]OLF06170.1 transcriptional regulator [Actinophytocola xinjiangensis]